MRLLLVANAQEPQPQDRKAQDQQKEVSSLLEGDERLDLEITVMAVQNDPEQSTAPPAGVLELLLCERKFTDGVEVLSRSVEATVQVVESEESAQELYLGAIREALGRGVVHTATSCGRSANEERSGRVHSCLKMRYLLGKGNKS